MIQSDVIIRTLLLNLFLVTQPSCNSHFRQLCLLWNAKSSSRLLRSTVFHIMQLESTFEKLFPDFERRLTVLPKAPNVFDFEPNFITQLTSSAAVALFRKEKCTGFCILPYTHSGVEGCPEKTSKGGVLFIPSSMQNIFLIKIIFDHKNSKCASSVGESAKIQLEKLDADVGKIRFSESNLQKLKINLMLIFDIEPQAGKKPKNAKKFNSEAAELNDTDKLFQEIQKYISSLRFTNLAVSTSMLSKSRPAFTNMLAEKEPQEGAKLTLKKLVLASNIVFPIRLTEQYFKSCGGTNVQMTDFDQVLYLYKIYFPGKDCGLEMLPQLVKLPDNILFKTDDYGRLANHDGYVGEVQDFWVKFVSRIDYPVGLLIKAYDDKKLNVLFRNAFNSRFETDWIYCGQKKLITFEVGRTNNLENPALKICAKIRQVLTKLLPTMLLILHSIIGNSPNHNFASEEFWSFVQSKFRFVVYFTNMPCKDLIRSLDSILNSDETKSDATNPKSKQAKEQREIKELLKGTNRRLLNLVLFLLPENNEDLDTSLKTLEFDSNCSLVKSEKSIADMMSERCDCSECKVICCFSRCCLEFKTVQYLSAILAFGCLVERNIFSEDAKLIADRGDIQESLLKDSVNYQRKKQPQLGFLNVILSPQQQRILWEQKRRVVLMGEPGSGKSALLLARAQLSAQDPSIDHVIFTIPREKTEFRRFLDNFVERQGNEDLKRKAKFIPLEQLGQSIVDTTAQLTSRTQVTLKQLHRSIVLADELYFRSVTDYFMDGGMFLLPHCNSFFVTVVIGAQVNLFQKLKTRFIPPAMTIEPLNILFRSSHHISSFSTRFIHTTKAITRTSARVAGCFTSPQGQIAVYHFQTHDDPILVESSLTDKSFEQDRLAIVFTSDESKWREIIGKRRDVKRVSIASPIIDFHKSPFTGCEALSVLVFADELDVYEAGCFSLLNLAITRAQYEVFVFINVKYKKLLHKFFAEPTKYEKVLMTAAGQLPVDLRFLKERKRDKQFYDFVNKLVRIAIQQSNKELIEKILEYVPVSKLSVDNVLTCLDHEKRPEFMKFLRDTFGARISKRLLWALALQSAAPKLYSSLGIISTSHIVERVLDTGYLEVFSILRGLIGDDDWRRLAMMPNEFLFSACYNGQPETIKWTLDFLKKHAPDQIHKQMGMMYSLARTDATLLSTVCWQNHGADKSVQLLFDYNFPEKLLLETFRGKNPLHMAIWYENLELVKVLLDNPVRRGIFLAPEVLYDGKSASGYARDLDFNEIAQYLSEAEVLIAKSPQVNEA